MDEYYDSEEQWVEEGRCYVCGTRSTEDVCSAVCSDLLALREGNDCYA